MTNCYNSFFANVEEGLGLKRHETLRMLANLHTLESPDALLRKLLQSQESIVNWRDEATLKGEGATAEIGKLNQATDIACKVMNPLLSRETRTGALANSGGNFLTALLDLWVQEAYTAPGKDHPMRNAHIVQYDIVNMEAVMKAAERMISATDRLNPTRSNRHRTTTTQFTDGYIRIINGIVMHEFEAKLKSKGANVTKENLSSHMNLIRLSSGDEFRIAIAGLDDDDIKDAMKSAQEKVGKFTHSLGFDSLPHLKYLKDNQPWHEIHTFDQLADPHVFNAFKYGGAGIKIGAVALGEGLTTDELLNKIDHEVNENREQRAATRGAYITKALEARQTIFHSPHKDDAKSKELGTIRYNHMEAFRTIINTVRKPPFDKLYRRPENDRREFPYDLAPERIHALPANNPEHYIEKFIEITKTYVTVSDDAVRRLKIALKTDIDEMPFALERKPEEVAAHILKTIEKVYQETPFSKDEYAVLQLDSTKDALTQNLTTFLGTLNSYECFDLTRKRTLDKQAVKIGLTDEQRHAFFDKPLKFFNARDEYGICLSGRTKPALELFQSCDHETRLLSYIGLSSFAGTNEVSTSLGKSINEQIRRIAAGELKHRFGERVLDFAFVVDSGRLHLLTHGITREQIVEVLSAIEIRVDQEINKQPLGALFERYQTFAQRNQTQDIIKPLEYTDRDAALMSVTINKARDELGDIPTLFWNTQMGETQYRPMTADDMTPALAEAAAAKSGTHIFAVEKIRAKPVIPAYVQNYLKASGFTKVGHPEELDLTQPLSILPNPKATHELGVRVVTGYVELLGRDPSLAGQAKNALAKLMEAKKRIPYEPGKGHLIELPVESIPHFSVQQQKMLAGTTATIKYNSTTGADAKIQRVQKIEPQRHRPRYPVNPVDPVPAIVENPSNRSEWFKRLDQEEFMRLHKRQVPKTILQLIADPSVSVVKQSEGNFKITTTPSEARYGSETPGERAHFIKYALDNSPFGSRLKVTGLSMERNAGKRPINLHVTVLSGPSDAASNGAHPVGDAVTFMEDLALFKARPTDTIPKGIKGTLEAKDSQYSTEVKAIRILRQYPSLKVTHEVRNQRYTFVLPPAYEGERQTARRERAKGLYSEMRAIFAEKAQLEEMPMPTTFMAGSHSSKPKNTYEVRIKENDVSRSVLSLMERLQYHGESTAPKRAAAM